MADLKVHLETNLAQAEALGQTDRVKALKARIAKLEKASKASSEPEPKAESKAKPTAKKGS